MIVFKKDNTWPELPETPFTVSVEDVVSSHSVMIITVGNRATVTTFSHMILLSAETSIDFSLTCLNLIHHPNPLLDKDKPEAGQ